MPFGFHVLWDMRSSVATSCPLQWTMRDGFALAERTFTYPR